MENRPANPVLLFLPLLTHPQLTVRRQACAILLATYGERALTYLRRLLDDPNPEIRAQARSSLQSVGELSSLHVELQPFRGLYIRCLGTLQVYVNSRELQPQDWAQSEGGRAGGRKVQGIFAYLIHCGRRGASREAIAEAVWGGPVSASSLSRTLSALRQLLAQAGGAELADRTLLVTREQCLLRPEFYHTDAALFERVFNMASHTENHAGLDSAVPLYEQAHNLYDGFYMSDVPCGSDWAQEQRDLLMNDYLIAAERLAEHAFLETHYRRCITLCRQALLAEPTAEDLTIWSLRAYARLGLHAEIERAFRRYCAASVIQSGQPPESDDPVVQLYRLLSVAGEEI